MLVRGATGDDELVSCNELIIVTSYFEILKEAGWKHGVKIHAAEHIAVFAIEESFNAACSCLESINGTLLITGNTSEKLSPIG